MAGNVAYTPRSEGRRLVPDVNFLRDQVDSPSEGVRKKKFSLRD